MNKKAYTYFAFIVILVLGFAGSLITKPRHIKSTDAVSEANQRTVVKWMIRGEKSKNSDGIIAEFNKRLQKYYPNTTAEFQIVSIDNYKERWDMTMATNESLDLAWIGNDIFNYTEEVKKGSFMALDYLLNAYGQNLLKEIPQNIWNMQKREGKIYSIPLLGPLYRKDYVIVTSKFNMDKFGDINRISITHGKNLYTNESCYEVLEEFLARLKKENRLNTGISSLTFSNIADKGYEGIYGPQSPFVIKIFDDKLKVYNKYELDSYKLYFKTMHEWYQKGYIRESIQEVLNPASDDGKSNGSVLFLDENGVRGVASDKIDTEYEAIQIPLQNYKYISYESSRNATAIPRTSSNPRRALEVFNLINSKEGAELYRLLANGLEGRHYVRVATNQVDKITDNMSKPLYSISPYTLGNVFLDYESTPGEFDQITSYNEKAIVSPLMSFNLDTRMIVLEMAKIDLVVSECINVLRQGVSDDWESDYNKFLQKMKQAGSEKVITEMQKQIDAFLQNRDTKVK